MAELHGLLAKSFKVLFLPNAALKRRKTVVFRYVSPNQRATPMLGAAAAPSCVPAPAWRCASVAIPALYCAGTGGMGGLEDPWLVRAVIVECDEDIACGCCRS